MKIIIFHIIALLTSFGASQGTTSNEAIKPNPSKGGREFKGLVLKNGLKVILVSDPNATAAYGTLHVAAGSMSDPKEVQGLAHLLEHMIFNGNSKYPEPFEFYKFAKGQGGNADGFVLLDSTQYNFAVKAGGLQGALNHLFHILHSPLLADSQIRGEISIVNSEHLRNVPEDWGRLQQIEHSTARAGHPFNTFSTGNTESLWNVPTRLGIDIHKELIRFYETYYSSNIMTLAQCFGWINPSGFYWWI